MDLLCQSSVPPAARPIKAAFCPAVNSIATPEHIAMGAEDTGEPVWLALSSLCCIFLAMSCGHRPAAVVCAGMLQSPCEHSVTSSSVCPGLCIYDLEHNSKAVVYHCLQGHTAPVVDCRWSPCEQLLASCDCDGLVIVWKRT